MDEFRFKKISIIPQYAMNAMNPTRKIGKMIEELLRSRKIDYKTRLPELKRRLKTGQTSGGCAGQVPD